MAAVAARAALGKLSANSTALFVCDIQVGRAGESGNAGRLATVF